MVESLPVVVQVLPVVGYVMFIPLAWPTRNKQRSAACNFMMG